MFPYGFGSDFVNFVNLLLIGQLIIAEVVEKKISFDEQKPCFVVNLGK